ncbi:DUF4012 domain-containing protein [Bifidobacterium sp. ESL0775]|nr:DUF4012 domain-containing protein [Bifidobacterium sp. ESL0775]WEV70139.1 DUF4012 domain-containing protein [Bifidobacterium sp. ESL0775]
MFDGLSQRLPQAGKEAKSADCIAHRKLWKVAAKIPLIGDDVTTVQGMTVTFDGIINDSMPKLVSEADAMESAKLMTDSGQLDLQPILNSQKAMSQANDVLQREVENYHQLPAGKNKSRIGKVQEIYKKAGSQLDLIAGKVGQMAGLFRSLPNFLGSTQTRHYAIMSMTTSEARSSGGLIGSVGVLTAQNGKISVGDFKPNTAYEPYGDGDPSSDERAIFQAWGPLNMSFDIRDSAVFPDTQRSAEAMRAIWGRTPWGAKQQLDGVMLVDPVFLQELLKSNGNVKLPDGRVLTGDNTAEFLLNTIYQKYPPSAQDAYFGMVAQQSISGMFSGLSTQKLLEVSDIMGTMSQGRHFSAYSFDVETEKGFDQAGYTAHTPSDAAHPNVGVYLTEQNASKMDWYIHRFSRITSRGVAKDGKRTYHVEYTMKNTLSEALVHTLPDYIIGIHQAGQPQGVGVEKVLLYPPKGGVITKLQITGNASKPVQKQMNGKSFYATVAQVAPEASVVLSFDVTTDASAITDLGIDQTPMGWADPAVTMVDDDDREVSTGK